MCTVHSACIARLSFSSIHLPVTVDAAAASAARSQSMYEFGMPNDLSNGSHSHLVYGWIYLLQYTPGPQSPDPANGLLFQQHYRRMKTAQRHSTHSRSFRSVSSSLFSTTHAISPIDFAL